MAISLVRTKRLEADLKELYRFRDLPRTKRPFSREEFDALHPDLFTHLEELRSKGRAVFDEDEGQPFFWYQYYVAMKR